MTDKRKRDPDDKMQSARFVETARQLGADESGKEFERALKKVVPIKAPRPKSQKRR